MIRLSFWITAVLCALSALAFLIQPVAGLVGAFIFFALARGIRRREASAAFFGAVLIGSSAVYAPSGEAGYALVWALYILSTVTFVIASAQLRRSAKGARPSDKYWAVAMILVFVFRCSMHAYALPTGSMENTLLAGDYFIVETARTSLGREPGLSEMIVFQYPVDHTQTFTKRVLGMPGDRLRFVHKQLYRNGAIVSEPYAVHKQDFEDLYRDNFPESTNLPQLFPAAKEMLNKNVQNGEVIVPPGKYFVLGDNRDQSLDSRYWGFVSKAELIGRPAFIYGSSTTAPGQTPTILNTRWDRLFMRL